MTFYNIYILGLAYLILFTMPNIIQSIIGDMIEPNPQLEKLILKTGKWVLILFGFILIMLIFGSSIIIGLIPGVISNIQMLSTGEFEKGIWILMLILYASINLVLQRRYWEKDVKHNVCNWILKISSLLYTLCIIGMCFIDSFQHVISIIISCMFFIYTICDAIVIYNGLNDNMMH